MNVYCALVASTAVLGQVNATTALRIAPLPIPQRVATADVIVVGKVVGYEDKAIEAARFPGDPQKGRYTVAIVKVDEALLGGKDLKEVRVGFIPPEPPPAVPGAGPRPIIGRMPQVNLLKDQEVCLVLTKHPEGGFYYAPTFNHVIQKENANFDKDVGEVRRCTTLLVDPKAGLKAKEEEDRFLTAGMLLARYRSVRPFNDPSVPRKEEPIDAAESKAILKILASTDWAAQNQTFGRFTPQSAFSSLGLTEKDGWTPPVDFKEFPEQAKKWLEKNAETYRIQRFVVAEKK